MKTLMYVAYGQELEVVALIRPLLSSGYQLHYSPFSEMIYNT